MSPLNVIILVIFVIILVILVILDVVLMQGMGYWRVVQKNKGYSQGVSYYHITPRHFRISDTDFKNDTDTYCTVFILPTLFPQETHDHW